MSLRRRRLLDKISQHYRVTLATNIVICRDHLRSHLGSKLSPPPQPYPPSPPSHPFLQHRHLPRLRLWIQTHKRTTTRRRSSSSALSKLKGTTKQLHLTRASFESWRRQMQKGQKTTQKVNLTGCARGRRPRRTSHSSRKLPSTNNDKYGCFTSPTEKYKQDGLTRRNRPPRRPRPQHQPSPRRSPCFSKKIHHRARRARPKRLTTGWASKAPS